MHRPNIFNQPTEENLHPTTEVEHTIDIGVPEEVPHLARCTTITIAEGTELEKRGDGRLFIAGQPITRLVPDELPTRLLCSIEAENAEQNYPVNVRDLLFATLGHDPVPAEVETTWYSAYIQTRCTLHEVITVFSETSVGTALGYVWGGQGFLSALTYVREKMPLFPLQFTTTESLFAACLCLENLLETVLVCSKQVELEPFVSRVLGGQAFLDLLYQLEGAHSRLPSLTGNSHKREGAHLRPISSAFITLPSTKLAIIAKEDEAPLLRDEIIEQVKLQQPLFLAMITLGLGFLSVALQPGVSGLTACLLPVASLSLALALNTHSTRVGQLNFIARYVLRSPYEIVRRYLFSGERPSGEELQVLTEQDIEISQDMLAAAKALRPRFPDQRSAANWILFGGFEGVALGILFLRTYDQVLHWNVLAIFAWLIALASTSITVLVLKHTRVRKAL